MKEFEQVVKELPGVSIQAFRLIDSNYVPYQTSRAPLSVRSDPTCPFCARYAALHADSLQPKLSATSSVPANLKVASSAINMPSNLAAASRSAAAATASSVSYTAVSGHSVSGHSTSVNLREESTPLSLSVKASSFDINHQLLTVCSLPNSQLYLLVAASISFTCLYFLQYPAYS